MANQRGVLDPTQFTDKGPEYLGIIISDAWSPNNFDPDKEQWHVQIKDIAGKDAEGNLVLHEGKINQDWVAESDQKTSAYYKKVLEYAKVFGKKSDGTSRIVGSHEFDGVVAWFQRAPASYYKDRETGQSKTKDVQMPVRLPTTEEEAFARAHADLEYGQVNEQSTQAASQEAFTPELVAQILPLINGASPVQIQKAIAKADLPQGVKNAFYGAEGLKYLTEHGYATVDEHGVPHALEGAAA